LQSNNSQSETNNPQINYGLYRPRDPDFVERNTVPSNDALHYANNLAEKVLEIENALVGTNLEIEISRTGPIVHIGPNDLVGCTSTDVIVVRGATSVPQSDQKLIIDSVKEALHSLDRGKEKLREARIDFEDGVYGGYGSMDSEPNPVPGESPRIVISIEEDIDDAGAVLERYGNRLLERNDNQNNNNNNN
jgi:hypothetical protein